MKRYTVRYTNTVGKTVLSAFSDYTALMDLLKGDAAKSKVETKVNENMPQVFHDAIAKHNVKVSK